MTRTDHPHALAHALAPALAPALVPALVPATAVTSLDPTGPDFTTPDFTTPDFTIGGFTIALNPVLRTALLVAWAALSGACREQSADPVRTAQAFTSAVQRGDMKAVLPLLEKATAERLAAAADKASDQVGGRRRIEPAEMLQIADVSPTFELAQTLLVDNDGATAHVRLLGAQQESYTLTLVHEDGAWYVRIPTPP